MYLTETINMSSCQSSLSTCAPLEECWCSTVQFHETEYTWKIDDFNVQLQKGEIIKSPLFYAASNDNFKWYLALYPERKNRNKDTIGLFLFLSSTSTRKRAFAKYEVSILINDSRLQNNFTKDSAFYEFNNDSAKSANGDGRGWANFLNKDETSENEFLQNDSLTISFQLAFFEIDFESIRDIFRRCSSATAHFNHLSKNFVSSFENHDFTDFTISVQGKDYPVHKIILASASDYFAKMFKTGMKESAENRVEITDVDEAVMGEVLRFVYSGKCENTSTDNLAYDLIAAADKYDLDHLKKICEDSVCKSLSVDNALNILLLADRYNANKLKSKAIDFIIDKYPAIMNSTTWDEITLKHPKLVGEMFKLSCSRLFKNRSTSG
ncbi:speckle-type POZ protein-like [Planococcus citri]|uniref:speckle-type POZ protein-like n=1 Tax=Planococcus citri TaxID=170843 RepID=UPI0031F7D654